MKKELLVLFMLLLVSSVYAAAFVIDEVNRVHARSFVKGAFIDFEYEGNSYGLLLGGIEPDINKVTVALSPQLGTEVLDLYRAVGFDLTKDGTNDIKLTLTNLDKQNGVGEGGTVGTAYILFELIVDDVGAPTTVATTIEEVEGFVRETEPTEEAEAGVAATPAAPNLSTTTWIIIGAVVAVLIIVFFARNKITEWFVAMGKKKEKSGSSAPVVTKAGGEKQSCPKCGKDIMKGDKFCIHCGAKAEIKKKFCKECGGEVKGDIKFCQNCGTKLE